MKRKIKWLGVLAISLLIGCGQEEEVITQVTTSLEWEQTIDVDGRVVATQREEAY